MTLTANQSKKDTFVLDPTTRLGHVHLTVANLDRQLMFYQQVLGLTLHWRNGAEAALGTSQEILLRLTEQPIARRVQHTTGMYHFAILYPSRKELARAIARLFAMRYPNSPTDHVISKTTYLDDLEGNNIELYVRTLDDGIFQMENSEVVIRHADGRPSDGREALDIEALFSTLDESDRLDLPLPDGSRIGHVHLYASSLEKSMDFYAGVLGFSEGLTMQSFRMSDVGLDDLQPHVVAFNTWKGNGAPPAPPDVLGLRYFTVVLPNPDELQRAIDRVKAAGLSIEQTPEGSLVRDPSHISVVLTDRMLSIEQSGLQ